MSKSDVNPKAVEDDSGPPAGDTAEESPAASRVPKPAFNTLEYRPDESGSPPVETPDESISGMKPGFENVASSDGTDDPSQFYEHSFKPPTDTTGGGFSVWGPVTAAIIILIALVVIGVMSSG